MWCYQSHLATFDTFCHARIHGWGDTLRETNGPRMCLSDIKRGRDESHWLLARMPVTHRERSAVASCRLISDLANIRAAERG